MYLSRISGRRVLAFTVLCMTSLILLTGCKLPWQHKTQANTANIPVPTTQQLFDAVQKNYRTVTAFHVVMQVQNSGQTTGDNVQIRNADGDVLMPDKVKASATVVLSGQAVMVKLISVGDTQFITDPITGQWRIIKGVLDPRSLTNPDTGIISLISKLQNVGTPTDDTVNDVSCWRVNGQLDAKTLEFITGGGVPTGTMLQTSACIGKLDSLPYEVKVTGIAAVGDLTNTVRTFELSNYNESLSITAPKV